MPPAVPEAKVQVPQPSSSSSLAAALVNAVRIKKLTDDEDEEVDITDDLSDAGDSAVKRESCSPGRSHADEPETDGVLDGGTHREEADGGHVENHSERVIKEEGPSDGHGDSAPCPWPYGARLKEEGEGFRVSLSEPHGGQGRSESSEERSGHQGPCSEKAGANRYTVLTTTEQFPKVRHA